MGSKSLAIRGVAFNWLGRVCALLITFVVTPILISGLGNEAYGIWAIAMSLTHYYSLADLGLRSAAVKYVAQHDARGDHQAANRVVVTALAAYALLAGVVILSASGAAFVFPMAIDTGSQSVETVRWVVFLTGFHLALRVLGQPFDGTLAALKRFDLVNVLAIGAQILQAILVIGILQLGGGLLAMAVITLSVGVLRQLVQFHFARRVVPTLSIHWRFFSWSDMKTLFGFGSLTILTGVARRLTQSGGGLMVGVFLGPVMVAYYAVAEMLVLRASGLNKGVTSVVMPLASQLDAQNRVDTLREVLFVVTRSLLAMAVTFATIFIALGSPLIERWINPSYAPHTYPVLCLLALAMVFRLPSNCGRTILKGMARLRFLVLLAVIDITIFFGLGALLLGEYGLVGIAWATLISQALTSGVLLPWFVCWRLEIGLPQYFARCVLPGVLATLPAILVALLLATALPAGSLLEVILQAGIIGGAAVGGIYFACFSQDERRSMFRAMIPARSGRA